MSDVPSPDGPDDDLAEHLPLVARLGARAPARAPGSGAAGREAAEELGPGLVVAIDGPSGSGKSSVSRAVARELGLRYLDTGAMYRALAWWCRDRGMDLQDDAAVAAAAHELPLDLGMDPQDPYVRVGGAEIGSAIRASDISAVVSRVATNLAVRSALVARQRAAIVTSSQGAGVVAEGRDITTVVAPDATVRVLLVADERARLRRRARQLHGSVGEALEEATRDEVVRRDRDDATVAEFSRAAPGVTLLDNSALTLEQSVEAVLDLVRRARPARY